MAIGDYWNDYTELRVTSSAPEGQRGCLDLLDRLYCGASDIVVSHLAASHERHWCRQWPYGRMGKMARHQR